MTEDWSGLRPPLTMHNQWDFRQDF